MSLSQTHSATLVGIEAFTVDVEVNASQRGAEIVSIVGLPDAAVREARDRVRSAIVSCGFIHPAGTTIVGLAPADLKKEGAAFDLPIALAMIATNSEINRQKLESSMIVGELSLDGTVRPVRGVLTIAAHAAKSKQFQRLIVPEMNAEEAAAAAGDLPVFGVKTLFDAVSFLKDQKTLPQTIIDMNQWLTQQFHYNIDFDDIKGQFKARRALEIAAAGGHNVLLMGPPGTGKSMISKRMPSILPPLSLQEALESTQIHSICGQLPPHTPLLKERPFRSPHHTISDVGLLGGQSTPTPGEISLAHNGVLFLDELPEFKRSVLEVLRQPLENGIVTISRASGSCTFPSRFILIAAMNPCPCGFYNSKQRECRCTSSQIQRYRSRISGPLLDRIDIHVDVNALSEQELMSAPTGDNSDTIRNRVVLARQIQQNRFTDTPIYCNAQMEPKQIRQFCQISQSSEIQLRHAIREYHLSARAYDRILRVARTIADLANEPHIEEHHIYEAIGYRQLDKQI